MSNETPQDGYGSPDEKFIPMADYEVLKEQMFQEREGKLKALDERDQLRVALEKVNVGIHKASDEIEGIVSTIDQDLITRLAFDLLKHHPKKLSVRYKGSEWKEIYHE